MVSNLLDTLVQNPGIKFLMSPPQFLVSLAVNSYILYQLLDIACLDTIATLTARDATAILEWANLYWGRGALS